MDLEDGSSLARTSPTVTHFTSLSSHAPPQVAEARGTIKQAPRGLARIVEPCMRAAVPERNEVDDAPKTKLSKFLACSKRVYRLTCYHCQPCKGKDEIGVYVAADHWVHAINRVKVQLSRAVEADDSLTLDRLLSAGDALEGIEDDRQLINLEDDEGRTLLGYAMHLGAHGCIKVLERRGGKLDDETKQWLADKDKEQLRIHQGMWQRAMAQEGLKEFRQVHGVLSEISAEERDKLQRSLHQKAYTTGRGLENPGGAWWAFGMTTINNYRECHTLSRNGDYRWLTRVMMMVCVRFAECTIAHLNRAFHTPVLAGLAASIRGVNYTEASSDAELNWLAQYAHLGGSKHKKARTLMVWRRSATVALSFLSIMHAAVLWQTAMVSSNNYQDLVKTADDTFHSTALDVQLVNDTFYRTDDPRLIKAIYSSWRIPRVHDQLPATMFGAMSELPASASCTPVPKSERVFLHRDSTDRLGNLAGNNDVFRRHIRRQMQREREALPQQETFDFTNCSLYVDYRNETFVEFAERVTQIGMARVVASAEQWQVYVVRFIALTGFCAWACIMVAFNCWYNLYRSKFWIRVGWSVSFLAPFLASIIPSRTFINIKHMEPVKVALMMKFEEDYPIEKMLTSIHTACDPILTRALHPVLGEIKRYTDQAQELDMILKEENFTGLDELGWPSNASLPPHLDPANQLTTRSTAEDLEKMRRAFVQLENVLTSMEAGCSELELLEHALPVELSYSTMKDLGKPCSPATICNVPDCGAGCEQRASEPMLTNLTAPIQEASVAFNEVDIMLAKTVQGLEMFIGLLYLLRYGLRNFRVMLPAALGLGPGMVNGALNVKLLTPQSALPGFVASILPWMYCPLMWCIYNFGVQAMGSVWLLMGLILLAYAPMGLVAVGSIKEIAKPMTDEEALSAVNAMRLTHKLMVILAVVCIGIFVYKANSADPEQFTIALGRSVVESVISSLVQIESLVKLLIAFASQTLYTSLAGVDFILDIIVADRRNEQMLEALKPKKNVKSCCGEHCVASRFAPRCCGKTCPCVEETQELEAEDRAEARAKKQEWTDMEMVDLRLKVHDRKRRLDDLVRVMDLATEEDFRGRKEQISLLCGTLLESSSWDAGVRAAPWDGGFGCSGEDSYGQMLAESFPWRQEAEPLGVLKVRIKGVRGLRFAQPGPGADDLTAALEQQQQQQQQQQQFRPFINLQLLQEGVWKEQAFATRTASKRLGDMVDEDGCNVKWLTSDGRPMNYFFDCFSMDAELIIDVIDDRGQNGGRLDQLEARNAVATGQQQTWRESERANVQLGQARLTLSDINGLSSVWTSHDLSLHVPQESRAGNCRSCEVMEASGSVQFELQFFRREDGSDIEEEGAATMVRHEAQGSEELLMPQSRELGATGNVGHTGAGQVSP